MLLGRKGEGVRLNNSSYFTVTSEKKPKRMMRVFNIIIIIYCLTLPTVILIIGLKNQELLAMGRASLIQVRDACNVVYPSRRWMLQTPVPSP